MTIYLKTSSACKEARVDIHRMPDYIRKGEYPCAPALGGSGTARLYSADVDAPVLCIFGDLIEKYNIREAGKIAARIKVAIEKHPDAEQVTMVTLANGATSVHPTHGLDLSGGYISGGFVRSATMFDVRNYRERVAKAIAAGPNVVGEE